MDAGARAARVFHPLRRQQAALQAHRKWEVAMKHTLRSLIYRCLKFLVRLFYPRMKIVGAEHLPNEPVIAVGNHAQIHGPLAGELYYPGPHYIWCAGQMMHLKEVPAYAFADFWSQKPRSVRWFYRLLSYLIAPISVCVFNTAHTIPVYHDARLLACFRQTVRRLQEGASIIIFPEHAEPYNHILCQFQDKFVHVARLYYKRTGIALSFVPMYVAPALKQIILGNPIRFCPDRPIEEECQRICAACMAQITEIAQALPRHTVVPYRNISKKDYPTNIVEEVSTDEKTRR